MWPIGSSGAPHNGQGGRPAATTRVARSTKIRAAVADHADPQQVRAVLVLVIVVVGVDRLAVLVLGAGLDQHDLVVAVPAQGQRAGSEGLVDGLVERRAVDGRRGRLRAGRHAPPVELAEELAEAIGEDRDLDLLEGHGHDAGAVTGLQEEGAVAGLADRAGDELLGRIEDVASSGHGPDCSAGARFAPPQPLRRPGCGARASRARRPAPAARAAPPGRRRRRPWPGPG